MAGGATSALGTLAAVEHGDAVGPIKIDRITMVGDGDYATGGTSGLLAAFRTLKEQTVDILAVIDQSIAAGTYLVYDHTNDKMVAFVRTTGVEVAAGVNLSGTTFSLVIVSK
jgi:hypothetical protein